MQFDISLDETKPIRSCRQCGVKYNKGFGSSTYFCSISCKSEYSFEKRQIHKSNRAIAIKENPDKYKDSIINRCYRSYKNGAENRNLQFDLQIKDIIEHFQKPCYYCGDKIKTVGIDRVDNSIGYTIGNIVPCCTKCNFMKRAYSSNEFVNQCKKVARNIRKTKGILRINL